MLSLHQLSIKLDDAYLFGRLSITFLPSSITYIKGRNGSGKTSLMRVIAGIQTPSSGFVTLSNTKSNELDKPYCLYIGHKLGLKLHMTVYDNLKFWASVYDSKETLDAAIYYFNLLDIVDKKCYTLSAGTQKRINLAKLMACQSDIWLLDEVEANLDQDNKQLLNNLIISKANNGGIILATSHNDPAIKSAQILNIEDY